MKKLFIILCVALCNVLFIFPMQSELTVEDSVISVPENFPIDCKKKILTDYLVKDVHNQINNFHKDNRAYLYYNVDQVCRLGSVEFLT